MKVYKVGEFADKVGLSVSSLQRLDREGKLKARRTVTNRRYYTEDDVAVALGLEIEKTTRKNVGYCRVSSHGQKSDLNNQIDYLQTYTTKNGIILDEVISDVGSGLNYNRKNWNNLLISVMNNEIDKIFVTYKDRFIRFGFDWFENFCKQFNTEIVVLNVANTSPEEELTEDLLSIIYVFSDRSDGLKKYKKEIKDLLKDDNKNSQD